MRRYTSGGPRFDHRSTSIERTALSNGIWLCQRCAKLVDSDAFKYTAQVLIDWKETAEHFAAIEMQGIAGTSLLLAETSSIAFKAEDWVMWRYRGNLPGDSLVVISIWDRGDVRYSFRIRLKNNLSHEEVLHRFRMEFLDGSKPIFSDEWPFDRKDVVLPPGKWVTKPVNYGLHDFEVFEQAKSVRCPADVFGPPVRCALG